MPPERSRQLIGNVWRYVTAASSGGGGGSQPVVWTGPWTYRWFDAAHISDFDGFADSGTYTLTVNGETTAPIAWDADPTTILAALVALPGVTGDDVRISDENNREFAFALGFLDAPMTGDDSLVVTPAAPLAITAAEKAVYELFTLDEGVILDNILCVRHPIFDAGTPKARLTDDSVGEGSGPLWGAPYVGGVSDGWDLAQGDGFTNLTGTDDSDPLSRLGARQVEYSEDPTDWYVTLPALAKADTPIYLSVLDVDAATSDGVISIYVQTATPVAPS